MRAGSGVSGYMPVNRTLALVPFCLVAGLSSVHAAEKEAPYPVVIHEDEFDGKTLEKPWGSWKSESAVKDGVMVGITPKGSDHPSVNQISFEPRADLEVSLSFKFAGSDRFAVMFRNPGFEGSHAGHICDVMVTRDAVMLQDGKTGRFRSDLSEARKAGKKPDKATTEMLKEKSARTAMDLDPEKWHELRIRISGDTMSAWVDGKKAGPLVSEGIAHPTKTNMNITTMGREMLYDHFSLRSAK